MPNYFVGRCYLGSSGQFIPTKHLLKKHFSSHQWFCEKYLKTPFEGSKGFAGYYTVGCKYKKLERNDTNQIEAGLMSLDYDGLKTSPRVFCGPLIASGINFCYYTTPKHKPEIDERFHLNIFFSKEITSQKQLAVNITYIENLLGIKSDNVSKNWSQPRFFPTVFDSKNNDFEYFGYFDGEYFEPIEAINEEEERFSEIEDKSNKIENMIKIIVDGKADTGLHEATRNYAYGMVQDGIAPATVKATLQGLMSNYDLSNPRQKENYNKINSLVDSAAKKIHIEALDSSEWSTKNSKYNNVYTDYPDQQGVLGEFIQYCMEWMDYPNKQIATIAVHALISTLGGRVYSLESGSGIILNALLTGRSGIGKSYVKKFCVYMLDNCSLNTNLSSSLIGSAAYSTLQTLIEEIKSHGTLLSIRTESGQMDKSKAGDMDRLMAYELELATASGSNGYVSGMGYKEKQVPLYSPAVTTVRESVAEIQNEADLLNKSAIAGAAGRRNHVIIDEIKKLHDENEERTNDIPKFFKKLVFELYKKSNAPNQRSKVVSPLPKEYWTFIQYKDPKYMLQKRKKWIELENKYAREGEAFLYTHYARLIERLPAWAARLAICESISSPIISNRHIDIAEESAEAELASHTKYLLTGKLDTPLDQASNYIISLFVGDMTKHKTLIRKHTDAKLLSQGVAVYSLVIQALRNRRELYSKISSVPNFMLQLEKLLITSGLQFVSKEDAWKTYKEKRRLIRRVI